MKDEFDAFLECGILAHGFLRLRCNDCGHDKLVAFSCKRRGSCPWCGARRMAQTAACLVDHVMPHMRVRQWVLSLVLDGVYRRGTDGAPVFVEVPAPTDGALQTVLHRVITRPALANERVQCNAAGQVVLKLKTPWRDGTTHLVMSPLEVMQRLAALVRRARLHLIGFHGVLAPNAKLRALVVPQAPEDGVKAAPPDMCEASCAHHGPVRPSWTRLLKRVFDLDLQHCPSRGGELKFIAAILEQPVIEKILTHLGLQARARPRSPARGRALRAA